MQISLVFVGKQVATVWQMGKPKELGDLFVGRHRTKGLAVSRVYKSASNS